MKLEHIAFNVKDPVAMAAWYERYLGLTTVRKLDSAPFTHFLADTGGTVMLEIYCNRTAAVPSYPEMHPLLLHLAFLSADPAADTRALLAAGATLLDDSHLDDGSHLVLMRDPWGLAFQLCKRANPMLTFRAGP